MFFDGTHLLSPSEFDQRVAVMASVLAGMGIQAGQPVALVGQNSLASACAIVAVWRLGGIIAPLNTRLTPAELSWQLDKLQPALILYDEALSVLLPATTYPLHSLESLSTRSASPHSARQASADDTPALIMFTSGTSGKPKGAVLSHSALRASAHASARRLALSPQDTWLCTLPFYHIGGLSMLTRTLYLGTKLQLLPKFDLESVQRTLLSGTISHVSLVPTMLWRLMQSLPAPTTPQALRCVLLGGAPATPELLAQAERLNIPVATTYGLTEAASQVATAPPDLARRYPASVGQALDGTHIRIVNAEAETVPTGTHGEIVVKGATLMQGYYQNAEATAKALRGDELFTGDIGYQDAQGNLYVLQRRTDLIITGGENVYPSEIEAILRQHPALEDAVIVGAPDPEWGQVVCAALILKPEQYSDADDIQRFARQHLAGYKVPRKIVFVADYPRNSMGKILRSTIADWFAKT